MANRIHKHAPWRKAVLIPFWCIQLFFEIVMIGLLSLAVGLVNHDDDYEYTYDGNSYSLDLGDDVEKTVNIIAPIYIVLVSVCFILTITEIILLARHKLMPKTFVIMNTVKSTIWTGLFVWDIISSISSTNHRSSTALGIAIEVVLLLSFIIPLIYGSVIYHRSRKGFNNSYKAVEHPYDIPIDITLPNSNELPSSYGAQLYATADLEAGRVPGRERRGSYSHVRDTRFDTYRGNGPESEPLNVGTASAHGDVHHAHPPYIVR